jgi:hypothetical protein
MRISAAPRRRRLYWDEYATRGAALAARFPGRARVFASPEVFASGVAQKELLRFLGFAAPRLRPGRRYNCMASCPKRAPPHNVLAALGAAGRAPVGMAIPPWPTFPPLPPWPPEPAAPPPLRGAWGLG